MINNSRNGYVLPSVLQRLFAGLAIRANSAMSDQARHPSSTTDCLAARAEQDQNETQHNHKRKCCSNNADDEPPTHASLPNHAHG